MWHASISGRDFNLGRSTLERRARAALDGLGDAALGEWTEMPGPVFHLRRRLSATEAEAVGPVVDVRGTPEADRRLAVVRQWLPPRYEE